MRIKVEIDNNSGFCHGVIRAVETAEKNLSPDGNTFPKKNTVAGGNKSSSDARDTAHLYSLGAIVHNGSELERLKAKGLEVIDIDQMRNLHSTSVLIRAHGEPPETYRIAKENNINLIDCTCPVVLQLQKKIRETPGQIVIFGKMGHAEVNGLVGQAAGRAIIVENADVIPPAKKPTTLNNSSPIRDGIDYTKPINIFSQTTKDPNEYEHICAEIKKRMAPGVECTVHNTICRQVASRHSKLAEFARSHNVIIFVSGKESSNGKVLYDLCKAANPRSYNIQSLKQIDKEWFKNNDTIGICGATSTPKWQLDVASKFLKISLNDYICARFYTLIYGNYRRF
ncbi:MAG TPA: 4-hydroxy-3-methylbut-2-enyl diphosphate reductase [Candidatus Egerieousia sp.]|nr:4-hydroxy-3-methylbut-2-enyl diphosphate reductase [Candidatus Egerieousia sp.]HPT05450.1 4-hydroxy-3-methylbut-2-enyl diphosphate reductase [Candidatus Egerieousia sp.]